MFSNLTGSLRSILLMCLSSTYGLCSLPMVYRTSTFPCSWLDPTSSSTYLSVFPKYTVFLVFWSIFLVFGTLSSITGSWSAGSHIIYLFVLELRHLSYVAESCARLVLLCNLRPRIHPPIALSCRELSLRPWIGTITIPFCPLRLNTTTHLPFSLNKEYWFYCGPLKRHNNG